MKYLVILLLLAGCQAEINPRKKQICRNSCFIVEGLQIQNCRNISEYKQTTTKHCEEQIEHWVKECLNNCKTITPLLW